MRHPDEEVPNGKMLVYTIVVESDYDPFCIDHKDDAVIADFFNNDYCTKLKCEATVRHIERGTFSRVGFAMVAFRKLLKMKNDKGDYF